MLVALGAIVIPFLLNMHEEDQWWGKGNIPKKPDNGFVTRILPLEEWSKQAQSELEGVAVPPPSPAVAPALQTSTPKTIPTPPSTSASPVVNGAATAVEGWVVQLGSFSSEKNAEELRVQLLNKGYRVFVDQIKQGGQAGYRVRIGPEQQRVAAETLRNRIEHDLKLKAIVLHIP